MRFAVIGTSGSGKSHLAKAVAQKFGIKYIEQDRLFWRPNWQTAPKEEFARQLEHEIAAEAWTICGNHSHCQEKIWTRATHVIWLNYPLSVSLWRGFRRSLRRVFLKEACCNGNREGFRHAFLSKNSILWWILKTNEKRRQQYEAAKQEGKFAGLNFLEFKNPKQAEIWFRRFS